MKDIRRCLVDFKFQDLFTEHLLWDSFRAKHAFEVNGQFFEVEGAAEKRGLVAFVCRPASNQPFPGSAERKRVEREVEKLHHEHLIIFIDREHTRQVWAVPKREDGKTRGTSEIPFFLGKGVEHLARRIQKLSFTLDETETATIVEVAARVNQALLAERVTKKFFKEFSDQRKAFVKFLDWIEDESKRDWYCSVLLNRLMFVYFLGGKGFLPDGTSFLTNNLARNTKANGADTFYTHFLLPLSFFGLGEKRGNRGRFEEKFKDVLYLDGGLFTVHQVERELGLNKVAVEKGVFPDKTKIPDIEFKRWFDYFDKWRWTLDEDKVENDGYISPHILGYIFEKYINQKQMGAYYTKEDITGYICRTTIIPRLFDMLAETGEKGKKAVRPLPVGPHPNLLNDGRGISDGEGIDRYIYASVRQEAKLPTETDYELEQRRKRFEGILEDFDAEKILGIDDFITYNLDIEKLALDFVSNIQDPEVLHAFYFKGLQQITVLDPTCGSGAFLFEALTIMYPLYNACLSRMRYLVGKATGVEPDVVNWGGRLNFDDLEPGQGTFADSVPAFPAGSKVLDELRSEVERINDHPSAEYFIKKSIIVNNLFGVDIMEEAVEICKLRLFLTLIATVERDDSKDNFGVEPLPDIDFNVLAGNTLVGYTSVADIDRLWQEIELGSSTLAFEKDHSRLRKLVEEYGKILRAWRLQQLGEWRGAHISKEQVLTAVGNVRPGLDEDLWRLFRTAGLATKQVKTANGKMKTIELTEVEFKRTHDPFHWLLEFPSIAASGGFDVIVGNPPYVELEEIKGLYDIVGFTTKSTGNLYALIFEQATRLASPQHRVSMIVPVSSVCTDGYQSLRELLVERGCLYYASFNDRPSRLFDGIEHCRLAIVSAAPTGINGAMFSTGYNKWTSEERDSLMSRLSYVDTTGLALEGSLPKLSNASERAIMGKLAQCSSKVQSHLAKTGKGRFYYTRKLSYFVQILSFVPLILDDMNRERPPSELKELFVESDLIAFALVAALNSSLFFWWLTVTSDCRNLNRREINEFPLPSSFDASAIQTLSTLGRKLMKDMTEHSKMLSMTYKKLGTLKIQCTYPRKSKAIIDEIDAALGALYGFSESELDHVVKYDIKYRMGQSSEEDVA